MMDLSFAVPALFQAVPALAVVSRNREAWLVGGAVRDLLRGLSPLDYDIVVRQDPESLAADISRDTGASFFRMGKNRQVVFRGQFRDHTIDIVSMAGDSIESDLRLRDFTINAMAIHLGSRMFLDPMGGQRDLENRTLRMVSDMVFANDPLRMLRAYRFAATLDFNIEKKTESAIKVHSRLIRLPAGERLREELIRLLAAPGATGHLWQMKASGLLFDLFPELVDAKGCTQNRHHCFDVLDHTLFACRHLESFLNGQGTDTDPAFQLAVNSIDNRLKPMLKLAMLLHDIGKPRTRSTDAAGAVHFFGHEKIGALMTEAISGRLKFSNSDADYLSTLIQFHLRPLLLYQAHQKQSLTRKGIIRLFRSLNTRIPDLLLMVLADICAKSEHAGDVEPSFSGFIADLLKTYYYDFLPEINKEPLVTGRDLISLFGLKPSPAFKTILETVEEARLSQTLSDRQDALEMVRTWLEKNDLPES